MEENYTTIYEVFSNDKYRNHFFSTTSLEAAKQFAIDAAETWGGDLQFNIYQVALYDSYTPDMTVVGRHKVETIY